jgi:hypothetical protein
MTPERLKVAEAMVFCIEHSEAADEICDCIAESLSILQTPIPKKVMSLLYSSFYGHETWYLTLQEKYGENKVLRIIFGLTETRSKRRT